ncbi:hypothetical protein GGI21_001239, partial [Coemansia aciculifera]
MGDSGSGNPGNSGAPLRIFTRVNSSGEIASGEQTPLDDASPRPREATNALLSSAFSQPYEESGGEIASRPTLVTTRPGPKTAAALPPQPPRVGRHGAHYHPLPSHWREHESGSSGVGSPVTPEGASGGELAVITRTTNYYQQFKSKTIAGQSPLASPRQHIGALGEAFGSASSLEWPGDRPGSTYSYQSTDQAGLGYLSEIQAESPLDIPAHGGRFPPALSSMAARPGAVGRSALGGNSSGGNGGASRHQASGSTSSLNYSFGVSSPPLRSGGAQFSAPKEGEDIVRKYLGLQRRAVSGANTANAAASADGITKSQQQQMQRQRQQHRQSSTPSAGMMGAPVTVLPLTGAGSTSPDENAYADEDDGGNLSGGGSIVFRRAVSSGDLPTLDEAGRSISGSGSSNGGAGSFLTPDLVESPLEALVRRLTIELFQLYVSEDRKKMAGAAAQSRQQQQAQENTSSTVKSNASSQFAEEDEFVLVGTRANAKAKAAVTTPGDGYIQQFRLGPSMRSGSNTPAVTMDGYFSPQAASGAAEAPGSALGSAAAQPRPRHRLVQRTWMEEALIKARRVSTIDETAGEEILQGLDQEMISDHEAILQGLDQEAGGVALTPSPPQLGGSVAQFDFGAAR